jgi:hypothetical protein
LLRRSRRNKSSPDLIRGSTKGPLGNERPFLSAPLFALFYQVEIRHPQPKKKKPWRASMPRRYNAIMAIL